MTVKDLEKQNERVLQQTFVESPLGRHVVSTVRVDRGEPLFESLDRSAGMLKEGHMTGGSYETMVFAADDAEDDFGDNFADLYQEQYSSAQAAERGHRETVEELLAGTLPLYSEDW